MSETTPGLSLESRNLEAQPLHNDVMRISSALLCILPAASCGRVNYEPTGLSTDASEARSDGGNVGSGLQNFIGTIGSTTCIDGTTEIIALTDKADVGQTLIVRIAMRTSGETPTSVSDSQGNSYALDATTGGTSGAGARVDVWSATVTTALGTSDTVSIELPSVGSDAASVEVFDGISTTNRVVDALTTKGEDSPIAGVITTDAPSLLYAATSYANHATLELPAVWLPATELRPSCGGAPGNSDSYGSFAVATQPGNFSFEATFSSSQRWALATVAYRLAP